MMNETALLEKILDALEMQNSQQADLWNVDDIARYLKLGKASVQNRILNKNNFPRPFVIPTTENGGAKRWKSKEVKQWANRFRKL